MSGQAFFAVTPHASASLNSITTKGFGLLDQREEFGAVAAGIVAERASGDVLDFRPGDFSSVR